MARSKLEDAAVEAWLGAHPGWSRVQDALVRRYTFSDYPSTIAFVVRLALVAEKRDHHPDLEVKWGKVQVLWTTHDAGGLTRLDLDLAEASDTLAS